MLLLEESQHLKIPVGEVLSATNNFETLIGKGGFGEVYRGELAFAGRVTTVAIKRLNAHLGQGLKEFSTEIQLLCRYKHPNLITLLGFCDDQEERVLVYEYADHGSLDSYLRANTTCGLTWMQRLKICVGAARGLDYLHNGVAEHHRVIHRDIKSANILLNGNWEAKISDLGLSKIGIANENSSFIFSNACGTLGYCDPVYITTGTLTKESDVYSFGVVLFEVLCGRLCWADYNKEQKFLGTQAKEYYKNNKLAEIIDPGLRTSSSEDSLNTFSAIAYKCLHKDQKQRPSMTLVVKELEQALKIQEKYELSEDKDTRREGQRNALIGLDESHHKNINALLECVRKNIGFSQGKPVAAFTIYKCLVHWRCFEAARTSVFDPLNQIIFSSFENEDSYDNFAYWLSNASALLFLIQKSLKQEDPNPGQNHPSPSSLFGRLKSPSPVQNHPSPSSLFGRMKCPSPVQNHPSPSSLFGRLKMRVPYRFSSSISLDKTAEDVEALPQFVAELPVLMFKQQLTEMFRKCAANFVTRWKRRCGHYLLYASRHQERPINCQDPDSH